MRAPPTPKAHIGRVIRSAAVTCTVVRYDQAEPLQNACPIDASNQAGTHQPIELLPAQALTK